MKIIKYSDFILETAPIESYSNDLLAQLKARIQKMFEFEDSEEEDEMTIRKAKLKSKEDNNKPTFKEFGLKIESLEVSNRPNSLTLKFSDDECSYTLFINIETSEVANDIAGISAAAPATPEAEQTPTEEPKSTDFSSDDIKKCRISFKKYSNENVAEILGQIPEKNVDPKEIDEEFIINLKLEVDEKYGDKDEFEIETK